jgi:isopentenyl-diphosphate Delta-isomerase
MDIILVNENDVQIGTMEKIEVHQKGLLHRAFSIFIFNDNGLMLLQQRATSKYHSGGLWTNACCSHPYLNQQLIPSAQKRLQEEMGFTTALTKAFEFTYQASFDNGLIEHEYDHVFIGQYNGEIQPNATEVKDFCYLSMEEIKNSIQSHPQKYTEWFKIAFPKLEEFLLQNPLTLAAVENPDGGC